jgi:hypothetical protein
MSLRHIQMSRLQQLLISGNLPHFDLGQFFMLPFYHDVGICIPASI